MGAVASEEVRLRPDETSTFAVVLYLDAETEDRLLGLWAALDVHDVASPARTYGAGYRPHLTLSVVDTADPDRLRPDLEAALTDVSGLPLTLSALGLFLPPPCPAYLAVTPTRRLLELHEQVYDALEGTPCWGHYLPDAWVPHCTLAMCVESTSTVSDVVSQIALPIHAEVSEAHLVEIPRRGGVGLTAARFGGGEAAIPAQSRHPHDDPPDDPHHHSHNGPRGHRDRPTPLFVPGLSQGLALG